MTTLVPSLLARVLDVEPVARLAVLDDDGAPEVMPIVFARVGTQLFSPIDGKPKSHARLARLRHIEARPRVALVIDRYSADWQALWWIRIAATARIAVGEHPDWQAAVTALLAKYPQYQHTPLFMGEPTLICFEPLTVRAWAAAGPEAIATCLTADSAV
ncbi:MAG: pyridoxamine 5'-phosphate oxidase family protein [Gammaproteobacteria bacterium]|nr:pyridoxamine 5'-phosphate oxidase family protein [Gammaproteobacteria bacterium]